MQVSGKRLRDYWLKLDRKPEDLDAILEPRTNTRTISMVGVLARKYKILYATKPLGRLRKDQVSRKGQMSKAYL